MPAKNPRIGALSMVTRDLIREALEIHENTVLTKMAEKWAKTLSGGRSFSEGPEFALRTGGLRSSV